MAVSSLISPAEVVLPRPIEALTVVRTPTPAPSENVSALRDLGSTSGRPPTKNLAGGYDAADERRLRVEDVAQRNEERVHAEVVRDTREALDRIAAEVTRIADLAAKAQSETVSASERTELMVEAREIAERAEEAFPAADPFMKPEVASLAVIALRPEILALADSARAADGTPEAVRLEERAVEAVRRIESIRRDMLPPPPEQEPFPSQQDEVAMSERERIESPDAAAQVAQEVRAEARVNSADMLLALANIVPQTAISLLVST